MISKGVDCELLWYYQLTKTEETPEDWGASNLIAMEVGSAIHDRMQRLFWDMDILEGVWQCKHCGYEFWALSPKDRCFECLSPFKSFDSLRFKEVPMQTDMLRGHADGILNIDSVRYLLELKSIKNVDREGATYGFEKLGANPIDEHFIQTQLYLSAWDYVVEKANNPEELVVDDSGKLAVVKHEGPVYDGARVIGKIENGLIEYIAKNNSQKKCYLIKKNANSISFISEEMKKIWKAYLEGSIDNLIGVDYNSKGLCKKCKFRGVCTWSQ